MAYLISSSIPIGSLQKLRNCNRKLFLCPPQKIGGNTINILNCYKQYFFGLLFSRNARKTDIDQSIRQAFLICPKRSVSQTFESNRCKKFFPKSVYHWYNLFRWGFFILCDNWKQHFLHKFIVTQRLGVTALLLRSLKQVFWMKSFISAIILQWC